MYAAGAQHTPTGTAGERLYTAEEIGARFGITAEEVMAIAGKLGIVGDSRYGQQDPSETPGEKKLPS